MDDRSNTYVDKLRAAAEVCIKTKLEIFNELSGKVFYIARTEEDFKKHPCQCTFTMRVAEKQIYAEENRNVQHNIEPHTLEAAIELHPYALCNFCSTKLAIKGLLSHLLSGLKEGNVKIHVSQTLERGASNVRQE